MVVRELVALVPGRTHARLGPPPLHERPRAAVARWHCATPPGGGHLQPACLVPGRGIDRLRILRDDSWTSPDPLDPRSGWVEAEGARHRAVGGRWLVRASLVARRQLDRIRHRHAHDRTPPRSRAPLAGWRLPCDMVTR